MPTTYRFRRTQTVVITLPDEGEIKDGEPTHYDDEDDKLSTALEWAEAVAFEPELSDSDSADFEESDWELLSAE